ncbi:Quinol monooxygenase YgiN [Sphingobium sp. AP50]|uniref:putative quinol monooxygenase n=1 Tax=Sphingobium sp. AP50 TaxID=1884369 RepID=UPI0008D4DFC5|nr:antibiotic biosynthesis monooxygenase [Sphingobium sp. AP50]SEJ18268.1 Quinol monooxygenase YgiN [Sphingobium sp. AP50]
MTGIIVTQSNIFISRYPIKPGKRDAFLAIFNPLWQNATAFMQENANFVFYGFGRDPNVMVAIESYKNEEAVNAIRKTDAFKQLVSQMLDLCSGPMTMELFNGLEMGPDIFDVYAQGKSTVHPQTATNYAEFL